jgi:predicted Zn-dependent protease with MMP-like domain
VIDIPSERFEELVADALDAVPEEFARLIENVAVIVEDDAPQPGLLGLYDGVPRTARADYGVGFVMPDRIFIFRRPICAICRSEEEVVDEVLVTVVHEIAHYFGIDDDRLDALGWG